MGLRLRDVGTDDFSWHDLYVIVKRQPADSVLSRELQGEDTDADSRWTLEAHLLAAAVDVLRWLQWTKTEDGEKRRNMPDPIPRPGVEPPGNKKQIKGTAEEVDVIVDWLGPEFAEFAAA